MFNCSITDCVTLSPLSHGGFTTTNGLSVESTVLYSCDSGFTLYGNAQRYCQQTSQWSGDSPACVAGTTCRGNIFILMSEQLSS